MITPQDAGIFSSIAGLPLHPLVVHLAVVLLPLSALALIVLVAVPRWRGPYRLLAVAAATVGATGAFVSKQSGEALADHVGLPADHAEWGDRLTLAAIVFAVLALIWFVLDRRRATSVSHVAGHAQPSPEHGSSGTGPVLSAVAGAALVALSLAILGLTAIVGHSGATAAWGERVSFGVPPTAAPSAAPNSTTPSTNDPSTDAVSGSDTPATDPPATDPTHSLAEIAQHGSRSSCWAAVNGVVYDLTAWIDQHPGGTGEILGICGTDATAMFQDEHEGDREPQQELMQFRIGQLQ